MQPYINLNLDKPVLNNLAENTNFCLKKHIKETASPKIIVDKIRQILYTQFNDIKKSISNPNATFIIPGYEFPNSQLDEGTKMGIYRDFLGNNVMNNTSNSILGKRTRKDFSKNTKNILSENDEHYQFCNGGPGCHCYNLKKLKCKLKPGARSPYSKTKSFSRKRFRSATPPSTRLNVLPLKFKEI